MKIKHDKYRRSIEELRENASIFWPSSLVEQESEISIIPKLLETQDEFIAILSVPVASLDAIFAILEASTVPANLFLKHLTVLADFGGEMLQRLNQQFELLFPEQNMTFFWQAREQGYFFKKLPCSGTLTNQKLGISSKKLPIEQPLTDLHKDVIAILLFGNNSTNAETSEILSKCEIGSYLGEPDRLATFIKQRYIWVSRITSGAKSNQLGQIVQQHVFKFLVDQLGPEYQIIANGHIYGVSHTNELDKRETTFDIVVSKSGCCVAIEISFQVTTNSVIERKSGQAQSRYEQINRLGHKIAYILDGAGNFQRSTALKTLCNYSHCTIAFSDDELALLCQFIREVLS